MVDFKSSSSNRTVSPSDHSLSSRWKKSFGVNASSDTADGPAADNLGGAHSAGTLGVVISVISMPPSAICVLEPDRTRSISGGSAVSSEWNNDFHGNLIFGAFSSIRGLLGLGLDPAAFLVTASIRER